MTDSNTDQLRGVEHDAGHSAGLNLVAIRPSGFAGHPYREFLASVERPSRYIGGEPGETVKRAGDVDARVCLSFPDVYEVGMSHLGTRILYALLNGHQRIACERSFSPWPDMEAELRKRGLPLVSLETATPLREFDVLGFSLQYELCYTNVLQTLELAGLPLRAAERSLQGLKAPLILAGGPTATHAEPLAPFVDAFFIGEAEDVLPALVLEAASLRRSGVSRRDMLVRLAAAYPLYVPELYGRERDGETGLLVLGAPEDAQVPKRVQRAVADLGRHPFPQDFPVPYTQAVFDRMAVEIARGCTEGCRFCQAGVIYRPAREREPVAVLDALLGGLRRGGHDEASITSLSPADYTCIGPLVRAAGARLHAERASLSISSLRAYGLQEDLLAAMAATGANGLTLAPEAGSQRLRDVISKNITEDDLLDTAGRAFAGGFQRLKLYFMVGLPTETDDDVAAIIETAARVLQVGRRLTRAAAVTASVSTFVPKPHTPLQWAAMNSEEEIARKHELLRGLARRHRVELRVHDNFMSHLEAMFSRGDVALADVLERAYRLGCRFDGWDDLVRPDLWRQALDEARSAAGGTNPDAYLASPSLHSRLPWDHIDVGVTRQHLLAEYKNALAAKPSPACGKPLGRAQHPATLAEAGAVAGERLVCTHCGAECDLDRIKTERLLRLERIESLAPPPSGGEQAATDAAAPSAEGDRVGGRGESDRRRARHLRPTARLVQGESHRYRLRYTKLAGAVFLGHLDLVRQIPRIFRRAGLVMHHSEGFHPKPEMTFGPALGLGMASLGELVDVKLDDRLTADELLTRLQPAGMSGLDLLGAAVLLDGDRALGRVVDAADFAAWLPDGFDPAPALAAAADGRPLEIKRAGDRDREPRTIDVRRALLGAALVEDPSIRRALAWGDGPVLRVRLALPRDGGAGVRPAEAFAALLGPQGDGAVRGVARLALWARIGDAVVDPLDIDRLRRREIGSSRVASEPDLSNDPVPL